MIEVYYVYDDETEEDDGTIIAEFYEWGPAMVFVDAYRKTHKKEMEEKCYGIVAYDTVDGGDY